MKIGCASGLPGYIKGRFPGCWIRFRAIETVRPVIRPAPTIFISSHKSISLNIYDNESSDPSTQLLRDVFVMGKLAVGMLGDAIEILDTLNINSAQRLLCGSEELEEEFRSCIRRLTTFVLEDSRNVGHAINIVLVLKAFERIGEHACNLVEQAVYVIKGSDIRHQNLSNFCEAP